MHQDQGVGFSLCISQTSARNPDEVTIIKESLPTQTRMLLSEQGGSVKGLISVITKISTIICGAF